VVAHRVRSYKWVVAHRVRSYKNATRSPFHITAPWRLWRQCHRFVRCSRQYVQAV